VVEAFYMAGFIWMWQQPPTKISLIPGMVLLVYFGVVAVIDLEHRLVYYPVILVGLVLGLLIGIPIYGWRYTLVGGITGVGIMLLIFFIGVLFVRILNRWRGIGINEPALGFGDVLLGAVIGLVTGFPGVLFSLTFSIIAAGIFSLVYLLALLVTRRYRVGTAFPYGPFMIAGAVYFLYFST
jgi:prepilin signal peptidase PulO-like enzyme (type II secretory pathway)